MNSLIDLAGENLFSTLNGQISNLVAELIARTLNLHIGFRLGRFDNAVSFDLSLSFRIFHNCQSTFFAVGHDGRSAGTSSSLNGLPLLGSNSKSFFTLIRRGKAVSDLLLPLFNRVNQRWPNVLHGDPSTKQEHDHLYKQRGINVHC